MTFQRSCLYHPNDGMRVIEAQDEDEYRRLLSTGMWFDHPNKAKEAKLIKIKEDNKDEKPIRQYTRKRRSNGEDSSE